MFLGYIRRIANDIDADALSLLNIENLKSELRIESFGIRAKIMIAIRELDLGGECRWLDVAIAADGTPQSFPSTPLVSSDFFANPQTPSSLSSPFYSSIYVGTLFDSPQSTSAHYLLTSSSMLPHFTTSLLISLNSHL